MLGALEVPDHPLPRCATAPAGPGGPAPTVRPLPGRAPAGAGLPWLAGPPARPAPGVPPFSLRTAVGLATAVAAMLWVLVSTVRRTSMTRRPTVCGPGTANSVVALAPRASPYLPSPLRSHW